MKARMTLSKLLQTSSSSHQDPWRPVQINSFPIAKSNWQTLTETCCCHHTSSPQSQPNHRPNHQPRPQLRSKLKLKSKLKSKALSTASGLRKTPDNICLSELRRLWLSLQRPELHIRMNSNCKRARRCHIVARGLGTIAATRVGIQLGKNARSLLHIWIVLRLAVNLPGPLSRWSLRSATPHPRKWRSRKSSPR